MCGKHVLKLKMNIASRNTTEHWSEVVLQLYVSHNILVSYLLTVWDVVLCELLVRLPSAQCQSFDKKQRYQDYCIICIYFYTPYTHTHKAYITSHGNALWFAKASILEWLCASNMAWSMFVWHTRTYELWRALFISLRCDISFRNDEQEMCKHKPSYWMKKSWNANKIRVGSLSSVRAVFHSQQLANYMHLVTSNIYYTQPAMVFNYICLCWVTESEHILSKIRNNLLRSSYSLSWVWVVPDF